MKRNKGFTLIELLAVLAILSILIIVSIPSILDLLDESKQNAREKAVNMVISAAKLYASDYKVGIAQPIFITDLCSKNYLKCPVTDPITETTMEGYIYSSIDKSNNDSIKYNYVEGTPIKLLDTILATVGIKDINVNKYAGNGLYKWGNKYIYRGGITKTNPSGTLENDQYLNDQDSGSEVDNYIKVPWETYADGENCTSESNKCYRIIGVNEDGSITIVRDRTASNQVFDNTINTYARNNYGNYTNTYGYNDLLGNSYTEYPTEYRAYSNMYNYLYGKNGYENTILKKYVSLLEKMDVCLNKVDEYAGLNNPQYTTTTRVTDTCNVSGKPNTTAVNPLQNKYVRLPYLEEYLNASLESTCTQDYQYQCRNQNYLYNKTHYWSLNGHSSFSWLVRFVAAIGNALSGSASGSSGVRPVVILKKDVIITGGLGTKTNPYTIAN